MIVPLFHGEIPEVIEPPIATSPKLEQSIESQIPPIVKKVALKKKPILKVAVLGPKEKVIIKDGSLTFLDQAAGAKDLITSLTNLSFHLDMELTVKIPNELSLHKKELSEVIAYTIMDQGVNTWAGNPPLVMTINKEGDATSENVAYVVDFFYECPESDLIKINPRNDPFNHHNPYLKWSIRNEYLKKLNKLK